MMRLPSYGEQRSDEAARRMPASFAERQPWPSLSSAFH